MLFRTFSTPWHHLLKPDFTCICTLEPKIFSVNEPWVLDTSQSADVMSMSYSKSCTRPVKLSIQVLQENKVNLDELLKIRIMLSRAVWEPCGRRWWAKDCIATWRKNHTYNCGLSRNFVLEFAFRNFVW
jgi:hypothetical protein